MSKYPVRTKIAGQIPYGYYASEYDPKLLLPNDKELAALEQAYRYCKTCSFAEVATWLSAATGRKISDVGLMKKYHRHKKEKQRQYNLNRKLNERKRTAAEAETRISEGSSDATEAES